MAKQKRSLSTAIIETGATEIIVTPPAHPDQFLRDMTFHPNVKQAAEIVAAHFDQVWLAEHGAELELIIRRIDSAADTLATMSQRRRNFYERLLETPRYVRREILEQSNVESDL